MEFSASSHFSPPTFNFQQADNFDESRCLTDTSSTSDVTRGALEEEEGSSQGVVLESRGRAAESRTLRIKPTLA